MDKFVFISDFDGTLTKEDFYLIVVEKFLKERGQQIIADWQQGKMNVREFLATVFRSINRSETEIFEAIKTIPLDRHAKTFIEWVRQHGGNFVILSAGTSYYIERLLEYKQIKGVQVISNRGYYEDGGIQLVADPDSPFYSETYGIDKSLVVKELKQKYSKVFFAGDSEPDLKAALEADLVFATGHLQKLLQKKNHPFIAFESFTEINDYLANII
ncbi:MAG TPA: MtnX-like HAD-IB family phosphatase [Bacillota bacterium]|nr:MtnX-like HAD-IB family phosphatase [Bacillota bacterium]